MLLSESAASIEPFALAAILDPWCATMLTEVVDADDAVDLDLRVRRDGRAFTFEMTVIRYEQVVADKVFIVNLDALSPPLRLVVLSAHASSILSDARAWKGRADRILAKLGVPPLG